MKNNTLILTKNKNINFPKHINLLATPDLYQPLKCTLSALNNTSKIRELKLEEEPYDKHRTTEIVDNLKIEEHSLVIYGEPNQALLALDAYRSNQLYQPIAYIDASLKSETFYGLPTLHNKALNKLKDKYHENISYVFGKGMIASVLFKSAQTNKPDSLLSSVVAETCMQKGLLVVHTGRESVKMGPPLTISDDALLEGLSVLDEAIAERI